MELKGSKTEKNIMAAFSGESQARNKYTFFANTAQREGYQQIAAIFLETADNEKEHARMLFNMLGGVGTTAENLMAAAAGEHYEWTTMYKEFAATAREEGFDKIADTLTEIAEIEEEHEKRYQKLLDNIKNGTVFKKDEAVKWHCRNCGYVHEGTEAPDACPCCRYGKAYFEVLAENH